MWQDSDVSAGSFFFNILVEFCYVTSQDYIFVCEYIALMFRFSFYSFLPPPSLYIKKKSERKLKRRLTFGTEKNIAD